MNLKSRLSVAMNPNLEIRGRARPIEFAVRGGGALEVATGHIHAELDVVPMRVAMPFMRNRRVVLASFGPFRMTIKPLTLALQSSDVRAEGRIGGEEEGIEAKVHVEGHCQVEVAASNEAEIKAVKASFEGIFDE